MDLSTILLSFVEMFSVFLIYNVLVSKKIFRNIAIYLFCAIITSLIYVFLRIEYNSDPLIILIVGLFFNSIFISKIENKETIVVTIEIVLSGIILLIFELMTTFIIHIILGDKDVEAVSYLALLTTIMLSMIIILAKNLKNRELRLTEFISKFKNINIIVLNLFIFFLFIKMLAINDLLNTNIVVQITLLGIMLIGINVYFYIYLYKTINQKKKNEIQKSFNPLINELMSKVKANEHEYKNHLNVIYGITQVAKEEELRQKIKEYIGTITANNEEFSRLLHIENTIIKAILYNKIQMAEKLGVSCIYSVTSDLKYIPVDDSELTVIFSNLLNNAIEATSMIKNKEMEVIIGEDKDQYYITVMNRTEGMNPINLMNIFKIGYSTKGEGRGYGLYNVKKIVEKYKGKIQISLDSDILTLSIILDK